MIVANIVLVISLIANVNREKIVLTPQIAPEFKLWIKKSEASPEYLNSLSRNVLDLLLNITPNNVSAQHQELMRMVIPQYRNELQFKLGAIAKQITQNSLAQNFYIENIRIISNTVYIRGTLNQYIDKSAFNSTMQTYKLTFVVSNYMVQIKNIELVPENAPQLGGSTS